MVLTYNVSALVAGLRVMVNVKVLAPSLTLTARGVIE
jgi:hypothetical protein